MSGPLIAPDALATTLPSLRPIVLDVRWSLTGTPGRRAYAAGHVPDAVFVDLDRDLAAPAGPEGRHPLPDPPHLQAVLRAAGVHETSWVVAYDAADGSVAARAWWLLRWAGHPAERVAVLDGGYAAWVAAGHPVTTDVHVPAPSTYVVRPAAMPVLSTAEARRYGAEPGPVLLDARAAARFTGEREPVDPVAGHIPGARNLPVTEHLGPDGRWRAPGELRARFAGLGVTGDDTEVGAYCGSGVTACALVLAMEYCGVRSPAAPAALYAGSWSQWCTDPERPVATGR